MEYLRVVLIALTLVAFRHGNDGFTTNFPFPAGVSSSQSAPVINTLEVGHFIGAQTVAMGDGSQERHNNAFCRLAWHEFGHGDADDQLYHRTGFVQLIIARIFCKYCRELVRRYLE